MLIKSLAKDAYSDLSQWFRTRGAKDDALLSELRNSGICVRPQALPPDACAMLRDEIDTMIDTSSIKIWRDAVDSDKRIFGFERVSEYFADLVNIESYTEVGNAYLGKRIKTYFALAARLDARENNPGSGGGWHRDSAFSHQFKTIFYLSDVTPENGPFQYVPASHTTRSKLAKNDRWPIGETRFDNAAIRLEEDGVEEYTTSQGAAIYVDTRGVHRGRPIEAGARYAITLYCFTEEPPAHFDDYLQGRVSRVGG